MFSKFKLAPIVVLLIHVCSCMTLHTDGLHWTDALVSRFEKDYNYEIATESGGYLENQERDAKIGTDTNSFLSAPPTPIYSAPETYETDAYDDALEFYSEKLGIPFNGTENILLIQETSRWFGTPYRFGGCSAYGIDCSCLVREIYRSVYGIELQRTSGGMYYNDLIPVRKSDLQEGDILCFKIRGRRISHVGIYLKDDQFVHSSRTRGVMISDLNERYYKKRFFSAGRIKENDVSRN